YVCHSGRCRRHEFVGKLLGCLCSEEGRMDVVERLHLAAQGCHYSGVVVSQTGDGGAATCINVTMPGRVDDVNAFARHCDRVDLAQLAIKKTGPHLLRHSQASFTVWFCSRMNRGK